MSGDASAYPVSERGVRTLPGMSTVFCFANCTALPVLAHGIGSGGVSWPRPSSNRCRNVRPLPVATAGGSTASNPSQSFGATASALSNCADGVPASGDLRTGGSVADGNPGGRRRLFSVIGILFIFITYAVGCLFFLPMLIVHPFVMLFDRRRRRFHDYCGMLWLKLSLAVVGIIPEVVGRHNLPAPGTPCVFVANHSSNMDVFAMSFLDRAVKCVVKTDIFKMPVFGWAIWMAGNIGVKRLNSRAQVEVFRKMVAVLEDGVPLVVYPEGTRSKTGRLSPFKPGAFSAAKAANVQIVPVTVTGTREMMPSYAYLPLCYPPKRFRLTVHPAINSLGRSVDELRDMAFRAIDSKLDPSIQSLSHTS